MTISKSKKIRFHFFNSFYQDHSEEIFQLTKQCLSSGNYIRSNVVGGLETGIAKLCNRKYAVSTASCTDALFFSMLASGIGYGDEVILPAFSYIATLSAVLRCRATPVFIDINPSDLMLDVSAIEKAITHKTKAILFVQLFGNCTEFEPLQEIAEKHNLLLIEDAAQAIGSSYKNMPGGCFGNISCISFDPTKIISAFATGGVLLTDDHDVYQKALSLSHHGRNSKGEIDMLGYNSKMSSLSASLIQLQLKYLEKIVEKYRILATRYTIQLKSNHSIRLVEPNSFVFSTYHKFVIRTKNRDQLKNHLSAHNIESNIHYKPVLFEHSLLKKYHPIISSSEFTIIAKEEVLSLPIHSGLCEQDVDYICNVINKFIK